MAHNFSKKVAYIWNVAINCLLCDSFGNYISPVGQLEITLLNPDTGQWKLLWFYGGMIFSMKIELNANTAGVFLRRNLYMCK